MSLKLRRIRKLLLRFSPGERRVQMAATTLRQRFYDSFWMARAREVSADLETLGFGYYRVSRGNAATIVKDSLVRLDDQLIYQFAGNKVLVHTLLSNAGLPVPGWAATNSSNVPEKATQLLKSGSELVCKPAYGTGSGKGVITGLRNVPELKRAIAHAQSFCDTALIEQFVDGHSYRLLFLDGKLLDAVHRRPPVVVGNGNQSIRKLIDVENERRLTADPCIALGLLVPDREMELTLGVSNMTLATIPASGEVVRVKSVVNQNNATGNIRVIDQVHSSVLELCQQAVASLGLRLAGVDLIAEDISQPADQQSLVINEMNTTPGLHHHYLVSDELPDVNVASNILETLLTESSSRFVAEA